MITHHLLSRGIGDKAVLKAMASIPREVFVPESLRHNAYADSPLPIGYGQTISQPYIVAYMTEALKLQAGEKVLEIGTGCGYQTAILAALGAEVYTVEIVPELSESAKRVHQKIGLLNIEYKVGNGWHGWPENGPYDAIIVTAAPESIPPKLISQLAINGRMVLPVGQRHAIQNLQFLKKRRDNSVSDHTLLNVRFVPLLKG